MATKTNKKKNIKIGKNQQNKHFYLITFKGV